MRAMASCSSPTSASDPVESLLATIRDAVAPLESGLTRAARDLESHLHWRKPKSTNPNHGVIFIAASNGLLNKKKKQQQPFVCDLFESEKESPNEKTSTNCLQFAVTWSVLLNNFVREFNTPFKSVKKCFGKPQMDEKTDFPDHSCKKVKPESKKATFWDDKGTNFDPLSIELLLCIAVDSLAQHFQVFNLACNKESVARKHEKLLVSSKSLQRPAPQSDHFRVIKRLIIGKKADFDGFLSNLGFARVSGAPASLVGPATASSVSEESSENLASGGGGGGGEREESDNSLRQKLASGLLNIPLSNVERLRSTLSAVSLTELIEFIPHLGGKSGGTTEHPDKKKLFSVQDFFRYAEAEGGQNATWWLSL